MHLTRSSFLEKLHGTLRDELGRLLSDDQTASEAANVLETDQHGSCVRAGMRGMMRLGDAEKSERSGVFAREALAAFEELASAASNDESSEADGTAVDWLQRLETEHGRLREKSNAMTAASTSFAWAEGLVERERAYLQSFGERVGAGGAGGQAGGSQPCENEDYFSDVAWLARHTATLREKDKTAQLVMQLERERQDLHQEAMDVLNEKRAAEETRQAEISTLCASLQELGGDTSAVLNGADADAEVWSSAAAISQPLPRRPPTSGSRRPSKVTFSNPSTRVPTANASASRCVSSRHSSRSSRPGTKRQSRAQSRVEFVSEADSAEVLPPSSRAVASDSMASATARDHEQKVLTLLRAARPKAAVSQKHRVTVVNIAELRARLGGAELDKPAGADHDGTEDGPGFGSDPARMRELRTPWSKMPTHAAAIGERGFVSSPPPQPLLDACGASVRLRGSSNAVVSRGKGAIWLVGDASRA